MKVLIIEDEPHAADRLRELVLRNAQASVLGVLDSVKSSVAWFESNDSPDLVLMDVQLADGISFEIFKKTPVTAPIIFTTAYDEYAIRAFKVNSIDYLLKPIDDEEFSRAINKFQFRTDENATTQKLMERIGNAMQEMVKGYKERFVTKVGEHLKFIDVNEILFFFSEDKTTFCRTRDNRSHILDYTLDDVEHLVDPKRYFRINRKYIVGIESIVDMISHVNSRIRVVLKGSTDHDVIVARERVQEFKAWLDR